MGKTIKGLDEFNRFMDKHLNEAPEVFEAAMKVGGMEIEREARKNAPYLTGNLRRSIHTVTERTLIEIRAWIGTNVEYALWLEYGTSKMPKGRPFLRPALDTKYNSAINTVVAQLRRYFAK